MKTRAIQLTTTSDPLVWNLAIVEDGEEIGHVMVASGSNNHNLFVAWLSMRKIQNLENVVSGTIRFS